MKSVCGHLVYIEKIRKYNKVKPYFNIFRVTEKRLKESREIFKRETDHLKKLLQDMKISTCNNPMILFCPIEENKVEPDKETTNKSSASKPVESQKSILKQPCDGKLKEDCPSLKKCVSLCSKTNLTNEDQTKKDYSGKLITVSTEVYLHNDPNVQTSNVTSTYYNKAFLPNSQSEKEVDIARTSTKNISVCTDETCPVQKLK